MASAALPVAAAACSHPWDDYLAPGSDGGSTIATLCAGMCAEYESCIGPASGCTADCESELPTCSVEQLADIADCLAVLESCPPLAKTSYDSCLIQVSCYSPP